MLDSVVLIEIEPWIRNAHAHRRARAHSFFRGVHCLPPASLEPRWLLEASIVPRHAGGGKSVIFTPR